MSKGNTQPKKNGKESLESKEIYFIQYARAPSLTRVAGYFRLVQVFPLLEKENKMNFSASNVSFFQFISLYVMRNSLEVILHLFSSSVQKPEKNVSLKSQKREFL